MKKTLLLFLLLLPFFGIAQADLVTWDNSNSFAPHVLASAAQVSSADISGPDLSIVNYAGFSASKWPAGSVINPSKYIQISIKAQAGYKIDLSGLKYAYYSANGADGCKKYQVRYSKNSSFPSDGTLLHDNQNASTSKTNVILNFPAGVTLLPEETMYIRFYGYDVGNIYWDGALWGLLNSHPDNNDGSYNLPTIRGTVSAYNPTLQAVNDNATSVKNNFTFINVISNDQIASNPISSVTVATQPTNSGGTAVVNTSDKTIKFTPAPGFTGATSFTYTIGDGTSTSTATVNVNVTEPVVSGLVRWDGPDTVVANVIASAQAVSGGNMLSGADSFLTPIAYEGFRGTGWTTNFAKDDNKYIETSISAKTGYKIKLSSFDFTYNGHSNVDVKRYQVRYSKDNFTTSTLLLDEATTTGKVNKSLSLANITLTAGETLKIRIYGYKLLIGGDSNAPIFLANTNTAGAGNTTPTFRGTVLNYDASDINANDDNVTTRKNTSITINALNNDTAGSSAITNVLIATQPASGQGTVSVNPDRTITFNPGNNFTGSTSFTYTISNSTKSATGTVFVNVEEISSSLVIWNGLSQQPVAAVSNTNITAANITASGMDFGANTYGGFRVNSIPTAFDASKYIQVSVTPKSGFKLDLTQFRFTYRSPSNQNSGPKKYQVRYSTDASFPGNGTALIGSSDAVLDTQTTVSANFPPGVVATNNQTIYIRIYVYDTPAGYTDYYLVHDNGGELGPTIEGIVSDINTLTANYDTATTVANQAVTIPVLNNDVRGSLPLQPIVISTQSTNGTATVSGEDVIFTPANGFVGETSFVYTLSNGSTYSSAAVFVTVTAPPCVASLTPGNNYWKGYVYSFANNTTPAATTYVGSVAEKANFDRNMGAGTITGDAAVEADNFCGTIPNNYFLVRYYMKVTTSVEEIYNFTIGADDGIRLYIDGNLVTGLPSGSWGGSNSYAKYAALYNLTAGTHNFVLEYYENGGDARASFSYAPIKGNPALPFGDNKWNVYGFTTVNITGTGTAVKVNLPANSYAGTYVDNNLNVNSQTYWNKSKSPSSYSSWQGAPISDDDFTVTYRRKGFTCGSYKIQLVNCDDVGEIYINGTRVFLQDGYTTASKDAGTYTLNSTSEVEIRLGERGGDANIAVTFTTVPVLYDGTSTPAPGTAITISSNTTLSSDLSVCSCTVKPGIIFTVPKDKTLTIDDALILEGTGKLFVADGGALLQNNTTTSAFQGGTTNFEMERKTSVRRYDYTYWSSPLTLASNFTLYKMSPYTLSDKYTSYNPNASWVISYGGGLVMTPGEGYSVRGPQNTDIVTPTIQTALFTGIPSNGNVPKTTEPNKFNLLGNPYPSAIDGYKLISDTNIGTIYLWTHNTPPANDGSNNKYKYASADYASFNLSGAIKTGGDAAAPTGYIAAGQGFFAKPTTTSITYTNSMRVGGNNGNFYKTAKTDNLERNRVWLNLSNTEGAFKQTMVGYIEGATNGLDLNYDAASFNGNTYVDFYSINETAKFSIQGRALPFDNSDIIQLGYKTTIAGDFTVSIDHVDGFFDSQNVYLEDKKTGVVSDLKTGDYTFKTEAGTFTDRFTLRYTNKTLGTGDFENVKDGLLISVKDKIVKVNSGKENIKEVNIFDISGRLIYQKSKVGTTEFLISNLQSSDQVLLVKVVLENDYTTTKKVIFK